MKDSEQAIRQQLKDWIVSTTDTKGCTFDDSTELISAGILSSISILELILLIEELSGNPVDATELQLGDLQSIDAMYENFFN